MVKPNLKIGAIFEDGGLYYEVQSVLPSGDYISKMVEKPKATEEVVSEEPVKKTRSRRK